MHPAISVIFFTVASGAGFGFMAMIGLGFEMPTQGWGAFFAAFIGGGLAVAGLLSSTFHLGHPERAWRAFSQWRSSWLSREGVFAVVTLVLFGIYTLLWVFTGVRPLILGLVISIFSGVTVFTTAMIYAQLKTVPNWHSPLTPLCYLGFSLASGLLIASAFGAGTSVLALIALVLAWACKFLWWRRARTVGFTDTGSDAGTATGLSKLGKVSLLERPHTGENYLTKEMVHHIGRKHAEKLRRVAIVLGAVIPLILTVIAVASGVTIAPLGLAILSLLVGLFAERWLFFAEAKHAVSLYY